MAPTPVSTSHRLTITVTVGTLQHRNHFWTNAYPSLVAPSGWYLRSQSGTDADVGVVALQIANDLKACYYTDSEFDGWILEEYDSGAWVYKASDSLSVVGTNTTSRGTGMQWTYFFRDSANKPVKFVAIEPFFQSLQRDTSLSHLGSPFNVIGNDLLDVSAGGLGDVIRSKGDHLFNRFIAWTVGPNRRVRRRRGIA